MYKLQKEGLDEKWLKYVKEEWNPKKIGKYEMTITCGDQVDSDPSEGLFVDRTMFDNDYDLSWIHHFFEGLHYIIINPRTKETIGKGIVDGSPFEEMEAVENNTWKWYSFDELKAMQAPAQPKRETFINKIINSLIPLFQNME
jgi:hypothetical protein